MKGKKILVTIGVGAAVLFVLLMALPYAINLLYYSKINNVMIPENAVAVASKVSMSDIYGVHICAEMVVASELEYNAFVKFIDDYNEDKNICIYEIYDDGGRYVVWFDDYNTALVNSIAGKEQEGMHYYLITNNTPYGSFFYE